MKVFEHIMHILGIIGAVAKGLDNYMTGQDYSWQGIALLWILNSYLLVFFIQRAEKRAREGKM